ncbi:MAG: phosphate acyltransferase PlsX [Clostridiales bacterium]|nr:phosphate acyltransferase PlsX [Clostridiales bacterium]
MRVIIDVMSGDNAPAELLLGAVLAATEYKVDITVVGNRQIIDQIAKEKNINLEKIAVVDTDIVINMDDPALSVVRDKSGSSMSIGLKMLANGEGDAFVSAGNTGALLAGATLIVRRIKGIQRAAIATVLPFNSPVLLIDAGANLVVTEDIFEQFAVMGSVYMEKLYGIKEPRVGLLNNGTESTKGTPLMVETHKRLTTSPVNFVGNVEGKEIPFDVCDVLVTDGFTGNVVLKLIEGMGGFMMTTLKGMFMQNPLTKLSSLVMKEKLKGLKREFDASEHGGAPLLGISKPVIKAHGSSDAKAIKNAVRQAMNFINNGVMYEIARHAMEFSDKRANQNSAEKSTQEND